MARLTGHRVNRRWWRSLVVGLSSALLALPGLAAERIEFFYGPFEVTVRVDDLQHFADTGEVRGSLRPVTRQLDAAQRNGLRSFLNRSFNLNVTTVAELTYSPVGVRLLGQLGELIQTDDQRSGFLALRASLILAAADEAGLTAMNILQQFPLETIQLNYAVAQQLLGEGQQFFQRRAAVLAALDAVAQHSALPAAGGLASPAQPGAYAWEQRTLQFDNPLRQTQPVADLYLPTVPAPPGSLPVVVISHGAASTRQTLAYLARHLASHGYAAVVLEHEDNGAQFEQFLNGLAQPPDPMTLISRPRDVTAVLDALEAIAPSDPSLARLDLTNVGVMGQSLGGYTALAVAGATFNPEALGQVCPSPTQSRLSLNLSLLVQCELLDVAGPLPSSLRDRRVTSAIAISPLTSRIFGQAGLSQIEIPVMVIAGTDDYLTPALPEQIQPFGWLTNLEKYLVVVSAGTHFSFLAGNTSGGALPVPEDFYGPDARAAYPLIQGLSLAFFDRYQRGETAAAGYLTQAYLDTFAQAPFRALIVRELPTAAEEALSVR
ncbi:alpha/beta hydrolase [Nodosilinea sp. LEGE 06152]|uniref:alpha/beta hydrolase n=1 Tax=Nodosilinea sp. LEGE 06152 TaxID=2777966 RepID=UPI0018806063|nr:alpha/beta hydrolase [Nodosilinea sp. LEGE 06152]MBE9160718.1 alpha/beta hydrolase [Nodosilinea sp. LEGE 06152]